MRFQGLYHDIDATWPVSFNCMYTEGYSCFFSTPGCASSTATIGIPRAADGISRKAFCRELARSLHRQTRRARTDKASKRKGVQPERVGPDRRRLEGDHLLTFGRPDLDLHGNRRLGEGETSLSLWPLWPETFHLARSPQAEHGEREKQITRVTPISQRVRQW